MSAKILDANDSLAVGIEVGKALHSAMMSIGDEVADHAYVLATMQEFFRRLAVSDGTYTPEQLARSVKQDADAYAAAFGFHSHEKEST